MPRRPAPRNTAPAAGATLAAALGYLRRGWSVLPLRPRDKRPLVKWEGLQTARPSEADVRRWFAETPEANLGIVTGRISGLVVVDIDSKHGGNESLAAEEAAAGPLPPGPEVITGGGGRHLYCRHPGPDIANRAGVRPGIDLRGDGGYVVAPPSLHPSGQPYRWCEGRGPDDLPLPPLPHWIAAPAGGHGRGLEGWRALVRDGVAEGMRNSTIASLCGHLLWHGVDPEVALELLLAWNRVRCRPPLPDEEVARTVASIARLHRASRPAG